MNVKVAEAPRALATLYEPPEADVVLTVFQVPRHAIADVVCWLSSTRKVGPTPHRVEVRSLYPASTRRRRVRVDDGERALGHVGGERAGRRPGPAFALWSPYALTFAPADRHVIRTGTRSRPAAARP